MTKLDDYFKDKPTSRKIFDQLESEINNQGKSEIAIGSQISFAVDRKFAWIWLYNVSKKNPEGTVQIQLALGESRDLKSVYRVSKVGKSRWNHLVVVHNLTEAKSKQLAKLIAEAYEYGSA
jgi:hypothetical protein